MATRSIMGKLLNQIFTEIDNLALDDTEGSGIGALSSDDIGIGHVPVDSDQLRTDYPAIALAPFGAEEIDTEVGTNASDQITYPVGVFILYPVAGIHDFLILDNLLYWREVILDHFIENRSWMSGILPAGTQEVFCRLTPLEIVDPIGWYDRDMFVSGLQIDVTVLKQRRV